MTDWGNIEPRLQALALSLESSIKEELEHQGHIATGKLRDSIKISVQKTINGAIIEGRGSIVGRYVDWGRRSGGRRVPIQALLEWIRIKGLAVGKSEIQLAWAIQTNIHKHGIPTDRDQGKTQFITRTLAGQKDKILSDIREASYYFYGVQLSNIIREVKENVSLH